MKNNQFITIQQLANMLGVTRIAVYKKVKKGQIKAAKIGRNFAIPKKHVSSILGKGLSDKDKKELDKAVKKTVRDYG